MKFLNRKQLLAYGPLALTGILIAYTGIRYHQDFLRILPLFISLFIGLLQSRVSRYASLIGGFNSLLYAYSSWHYRLMASAAYALVVSFPLQIVTFILWQRHAYKGSTKLRRMTKKQLALLLIGTIAAWCAMFVILKALNSSYQLLDNTSTLFGVLITILYMFAFVEYTYLMIPSCIFSVILNATIMMDKPEMSTYFVFSIYSLGCNILGFFRARKLYAEQQAANLKA